MNDDANSETDHDANKGTNLKHEKKLNLDQVDNVKDGNE